ncbi:MAG TPA: tetratricopeptide repeat protein [Burkholderiales bacterium]|nr:tetratricopeptide repeat protein [Burkholderiales bacterium]
MSLLLEALKKAEKAKEEAQRRAREGGNAPEAPATPPVPERKPVVTRDKLPDVSMSLEIANDEIAPPPAPERAVAEPTLDAPPPPKPAPAAKAPPARPAASKPADDEAAGRASAKKVFEAKFREPNPRLPFYITMGVLGVFALSTVIYFWYQLRPPPALVNTNPPSQTQSAQAAPSEVRVPAVAAAPAASEGAIPGLPSAPAKSGAPAATASAAKPPPKPVIEAQAEVPRLTPRLVPNAPVARLPAVPARETATVSRHPAQVHPSVEAGYTAYLTGDLAAARSEYQQALREEPANRDALLGLAALEVRGGRYETAEALYMRVLQGDPRDAQAQAALIALRSGRSDPLITESRVKSMLAADPAAHALNFTLGNQLAQQNRWAEAQQEYFKAYTAEPENADFAYNVAVSLDHLRQNRQALDYYQRAIALAEKRGASFDLAAARARAAELGK